MLRKEEDMMGFSSWWIPSRKAWRKKGWFWNWHKLFGLDTGKNFLAVNIIKPLNCDDGSLLYSVILDQNLEVKFYISFAFSISLHEKY